jgi:hypothetical protein
MPAASTPAASMPSGAATKTQHMEDTTPSARIASKLEELETELELDLENMKLDNIDTTIVG